MNLTFPVFIQSALSWAVTDLSMLVLIMLYGLLWIVTLAAQKGNTGTPAHPEWQAKETPAQRVGGRVTE